MALNLGEKMKIYPQVLTFFIKPQTWPFHVVVLQRNGQKWKMHVQSVQSYYFFPLNMQIYDILVAVAVVVA